MAAGSVVLSEGRDVGGMACQIELSADFGSSDSRFDAVFAAHTVDIANQAGRVATDRDLPADATSETVDR